MKNTSFVAERFGLEFSRGSVDLKRGFVPGVRVVNAKSRNGRRYPPAVLAKHFALYGVGVNVGHHYDPNTMMPTEVPPTDRFGRLVNPRIHNGGINADLHFNPEHHFAKPFGWAVLNDPSQYSFSPLHRVKWKASKDADGDVVAEAILEVASVDVVSDGGTTSTIFESRKFTKEGRLMIPEVEGVVSQLTTAGAAAGFLVDLWNALAAKFQGAELEALRAVVAGFASGTSAAPADSGVDAARQAMADGEMAAMGAAESRRRAREFVASQVGGFVKDKSVSDLVAGWTG